MSPDQASNWHDLLVTAGAPGVALSAATNAAVGQPPSWLVFGAVGWLTASGEMGLATAVLAWAFGYTAGSSMVFAALSRFGRGWLDRLLIRLGRDPAMFERADSWFRRYGGWAVLPARIVPGFGWMITVPAGLSGMRWLPFAAATLVGSGLFALALAVIAHALGDRFIEHMADFRQWWTPVAIGLALAIAVLCWFRRLWRR